MLRYGFAFDVASNPVVNELIGSLSSAESTWFGYGFVIRNPQQVSRVVLGRH